MQIVAFTLRDFTMRYGMPSDSHLLHASYTPLTHLMHASYTPLMLYLYTHLTRLLRLLHSIPEP